MSFSTKGAGTGTDNASHGTVAWTNPGNITLNDGSNATIAGISFPQTTVSHYLKAAGFGFAVPVGSTFTGFGLSIVHSAGTVSAIQDESVILASTGAGSSSDKKSVVLWATTSETFTYGGDGDLWGGFAPTVADFNSTISASMACTNTALGFNGANCDYMELTVWYIMPATSGGTLFSQRRRVKVAPKEPRPAYQW